jgi:hypothetical protein
MPRERRAQAQHFPGAGYAQHQTLALLGTNGKFSPAIAEHEDPARLAPFGKQSRASRVLGNGLNAIERLERVRRQIAKKPIRPQFTTETTGMTGALHASTNTAPVAVGAVIAVTENRDA